MLVIIALENAYPAFKLIPFALAAVSLVILIIFSSQFRVRHRMTQTHTIIALVSVLFAMGYGAIGSYLLREQFKGIHNFTDAIYYTLVTYSTVGYGDITPQTNDAKLFVITMIFIGIGAFATVVSVLIGPLLEGKLKKVFSMVEQFNHMRGHAIICNVTQITMQIAKDMQKQNIDVVFIETDAQLIKQLDRLNLNIISGDSTDMHILKNAGLVDAKYFVIGDGHDGQTILTGMTAKNYLKKHSKKQHPEMIFILDKPENSTSAREVGADRIVIPALLASQALASDL
jgi:voltage-gated potassium channel